MVIWLDVAEEIRRVYYDKKIVLICNNACLSLVENLPFFNEIIGIDKHKLLFNIGYRINLIKKIVSRKFEKVINPVYSRDYFFQDILVKLIRGKEKIGSKGQYSNNNNIISGFASDLENIEKFSNKLKQKGDKYYDNLTEVLSTNLMEKTRNAEFCRKCINPDFKSYIPKLCIELPELNMLSSLKSKDYILIFIGASTSRKLWKKQNYVDLIKEIKGKNIVVSAGKGEEKIWNEIKEEYSFEYINNVIDLIGKTSLIELFSLIKHAQYIITNDTSASHITVLTRTPSVCLLGGGHYGRFQPYEIEAISEEDKKILPKVVNYEMDCYGCNAICKYIKDKETTWPCIENIKVEQVLEKIKEIENDLP
jgi:ADP-heptose:LPS heptosyltransferase